MLAGYLPFDEEMIPKLFKKIIDTGLYDLAFRAFPISEFGRKRLADTAWAKAGAADALDPARDTSWLTQLTNVVKHITRSYYS